MISKDSRSYPYLAIAQHYNISYAEVLQYSDYIRNMNAIFPYTEWMIALWKLDHDLGQSAKI